MTMCFNNFENEGNPNQIAKNLKNNIGKLKEKIDQISNRYIENEKLVSKTISQILSENC